MKKFNSVKHAVQLAQILPADDELFENRSDEWWCKFWHVMGEREAKRLKENDSERL